jgi:hypothetical protein
VSGVLKKNRKQDFVWQGRLVYYICRNLIDKLVRVVGVGRCLKTEAEQDIPANFQPTTTRLDSNRQTDMVWPSFFIVTNEGGLKLFTVQYNKKTEFRHSNKSSFLFWNLTFVEVKPLGQVKLLTN